MEPCVAFSNYEFWRSIVCVAMEVGYWLSETINKLWDGDDLKISTLENAQRFPAFAPCPYGWTICERKLQFCVGSSAILADKANVFLHVGFVRIYIIGKSLSKNRSTFEYLSFSSLFSNRSLDKFYKSFPMYNLIKSCYFMHKSKYYSVL